MYNLLAGPGMLLGSALRPVRVWDSRSFFARGRQLRFYWLLYWLRQLAEKEGPGGEDPVTGKTTVFFLVYGTPDRHTAQSNHHEAQKGRC